MFHETKKVPRSSESTEIDVREDEEQAIKLQEIIELLVAAGYFRARIKGLSNFDKIVGGMTWCIESCNFDVDVDLLFRENLTIGQKIALTEKIVSALPKMNCPHRIEPHQIQGLDCIHIFPVIQWLVKRSMETREEMADFVRSFAIGQFTKTHSFKSEKWKDDASTLSGSWISNISAVKRSYDPRRFYKRVGPRPSDELSQFRGTLLEYGGAVISRNQESSETSPGTSSEAADLKSELSEGGLAPCNEIRLSANTVETIVGKPMQEIAEITEKFSTPTEGPEEIGIPVSEVQNTLTLLRKQKNGLQSRASKLQSEKNSLTEKVEEIGKKVSEIRMEKESIQRDLARIREAASGENEKLLAKLEVRLAIHDGLKDQEHKFREQCKKELANLQTMLEELSTTTPLEEQTRLSEYESQREAVSRLRLKLAKKNRAIASLTRQLDDVPGRSELTQYQRRFMELYNQVSAKHKETKQYYTLYNTLDDTKLYLSKELSLLNSIQDNYNEAMASSSGREEFLKQFEAIVMGVKQNKAKVEKRRAEEKNRRDLLSRQLVTLVEQQRKYVAAVRQLNIECRKNEALLARLRGS